jgi:hypothetical protein
VRNGKHPQRCKVWVLGCGRSPSGIGRMVFRNKKNPSPGGLGKPRFGMRLSMVALVKHDMGCPLRQTNTPHTDAAKRVFDTYHLHRSAVGIYDVIGKWFASSLNDGSTDGVLYDSRPDAIRHQHHNEKWFTFVQVSQYNMTVCSAEVMLGIARKFDASLMDRDSRGGGRQLIARATWEDQLAQMCGRPQNLRMPKE